MANPEHQEVLDSFDKVSVCLYRGGISLFSVSLLYLAVILSGIDESLLSHYPIALLLIAVSAAFSAGNVHVYSKFVRAAISWSAWIGILLMLSDSGFERIWLSLGFIFVTFSGIALKESFCFKVMGLKLVPMILALSVFLLWINQTQIASFLVGLSGLIIGYLSIAKWRMPLHFDIGNKANYQV